MPVYTAPRGSEPAGPAPVAVVAPGGKIVYGGGGIMPDIFIPIEKNPALKFYNESFNKGILYQFAFDYTDQRRSDFKKFRDVKSFDNGFMISDAVFNEYVIFAANHGIKPTEAEIKSSAQKIKELLKAFIARNLFDDKGFYPIYLRTDKTFEKALGSFK